MYGIKEDEVKIKIKNEINKIELKYYNIDFD